MKTKNQTRRILFGALIGTLLAGGLVAIAIVQLTTALVLASVLAVVSIGIHLSQWRRKNRVMASQDQEKRQLLECFRAVFDNMPQGVSLFDSEERLVIANNQYADFYKLSPEDIKPGTHLNELRRSRKAAGTPEYTLVNSDGKFAGNNSPIDGYVGKWRLDDGRTIETRHHLIPGGGWVAVHNDITEQLTREAERKGARKFLNSVIDHIPGAVIVKKPDDLRYLLINKQLEQVIGLNRNAILGKTSRDFFSPAQAEIITARDQLALQDPHETVHGAEELVHTPGRGSRRIATRRIVVRDGNETPAYLITMTEDVTEKRQAEQKIQFLANHDPLTGLHNRIFFRDQLERKLDGAVDDEGLALILVDIEGIKAINDAAGHAAGDEALRITGERLASLFCDIDIVARLGGAEYAILCQSASCQLELEDIARRIIAKLQAPIEIGVQTLRVTARVGIAIAKSVEYDAGTLMRYADIALYEAKERDHTQYCFFDLTMLARKMERKQLESDMAGAVSRGEFELYYQPIVDPRSNTVRSFEALLR